MNKEYIVNNNLRKFREAKKLKQQDVAKELGLHSNARISKWENGIKTPSLVNLFRLSRIYGVSVDSLYPLLSSEELPPSVFRQD